MSKHGSAVAHTATIAGVRPLPVEVQVDVRAGLPSFQMVGLADAAVLEARERVRSAIHSSGFEFPNARIVVNLAPAPIRKHGTGFDLPIAVGILVASGQVASSALEDAHLVGELSLSGDIRPVKGLLAHGVAAHTASRSLVGPAEAARSTKQLSGVEVITISHLREIVLPRGLGPSASPSESDAPGVREAPTGTDLAEVAGQEMAKRALVVSAAGSHNLLIVGPPGSGKSMLARRLPPILPALDDAERLETALVHSVAGLDETAALRGVRPFRAPHHTATRAGLIGGGSPVVPGEVSLSHNGVLFLDEMPEFGPATLQALRQVLEDGYVTLVRADGRLRFPSRFTLVAAANPCPCGYLGVQQKMCTCAETAVRRYQNRIGGPLLDRLELSLRVDPVDPSSILSSDKGMSTQDARALVQSARSFAMLHGGPLSADSTRAEILSACRMTPDDSSILEMLSARRKLSGRALTRALKVARTIADIEHSPRVERSHLMEALSYRFDCGLG